MTAPDERGHDDATRNGVRRLNAPSGPAEDYCHRRGLHGEVVRVHQRRPVPPVLLPWRSRLHSLQPEQGDVLTQRARLT